jgi:enoyl-[acyl-carrier protein] reductase I
MHYIGHFLSICMQVHSLANGPEVTKPLLETSRKGYLAALSASSYSFVSMMQRFAPIMNEGGAAISLTYIAADQVIPGYGGGMSSAKAALESDTKVLAYEAGRKHKVGCLCVCLLSHRWAVCLPSRDGDVGYTLHFLRRWDWWLLSGDCISSAKAALES